MSTTEHVVKYRNRFPIQPGKGLCRGCHKPVPAGRHSWCSNDCYDKYHPVYVRRAVWVRDQGICQICHFDLAKTIMDEKEKKGWKRPTLLRAQHMIKWECDHILPYSKGGLTIAENMRVLCHDCHKERHGKRKPEPELPLAMAAAEKS